MYKRIQQRRSTWFGHVDDNRIPRRVLRCYIIGNRSREKQRETWMDYVKEELQTCNKDIRDVTDLTRDRTICIEESCTNSSSVYSIKEQE